MSVCTDDGQVRRRRPHRTDECSAAAHEATRAQTRRRKSHRGSAAAVCGGSGTGTCGEARGGADGGVQEADHRGGETETAAGARCTPPGIPAQGRGIFLLFRPKMKY